MANDFIINADGTLTKKGISSSSRGGSGSSSDNTGCIWAFIIAVCVIVGIVIAANSNSSDNHSHSKPEKIVTEVISSNTSEEEDTYAEDTYTEETNNEATYLSVSESSVTFDSDGGSIDIEISTDGEWEIGTSTADWGHLSIHSSSVTLRIDSYSGDEDRTDWFTIEAGDYEERINITQHANNNPSASIERVWVDHNEYYNGANGMMIHADISVENLEGETVYVYTYFYQGDNTTPLHDPYGNNLYFYGTGNVNHKSGRFEDFKIFVPYVGLNMAPGSSGTLSFDVSVKCGGEQLDRDNNNQFTFSSGY